MGWCYKCYCFISIRTRTMDLRTDGNSFKNDATTPTGDVLLSTKNFAKGDNYSIIVEFR